MIGARLRCLIAATVLAIAASDATGAIIPVTTRDKRSARRADVRCRKPSTRRTSTTTWRLSTFNGSTPVEVVTQCVPGNGDDIIVLPAWRGFQPEHDRRRSYNPTGPTATPIITSNITILAYGATLEHTGTRNFRLFAVGSTGHLTLRRAYIRGFGAGRRRRRRRRALSGRGGGGGDGGGRRRLCDGRWAGGRSEHLRRKRRAGGKGGAGTAAAAAAWAAGARQGGGFFGGGGGGGGGASGNGGRLTLRVAVAVEPYPVRQPHRGEVACGGSTVEAMEGSRATVTPPDAPVAGGWRRGRLTLVLFSPAAMAARDFTVVAVAAVRTRQGSGGRGGFGGGGGSGMIALVDAETAATAGSAAEGALPRWLFGRRRLAATADSSPATAAIAAMAAAVAPAWAAPSSTTAARRHQEQHLHERHVAGGGFSAGAQDGIGGGGAIFSRNGFLTVLNSTISGNVASFGGGIIVAQDSASAPTSFVLQNTIVANNGRTSARSAASASAARSPAI